VLGGIVIRERDGFGSALLAKLRAFHDRGPTPLPDDERRALLIWSQVRLGARAEGWGYVPLHSPAFTVDEDVLPLGSSFFAEAVREAQRRYFT
jgi:metal-dependent amidase/aminoacylase/carboxypeptidase family protein